MMNILINRSLNSFIVRPNVSLSQTRLQLLLQFLQRVGPVADLILQFRRELPESLIVTATSEDGEIMGLRHREKLIEGIQYHPESVLTRSGRRQLRNFIRLVREYRSGGSSC